VSSVLIVDDEADIRLLCRLVLEGRGHEVVEAESAELGLQMLQTFTADFVVLDIRMPGMGGWEMLERVRNDGHLNRMKVIVCSAHAGPVDQHRAEAEGAYAFLSKPFLPIELLGLLGVAAEPEQPS
jgi:CheY-like chemotaxis protein